MPDCKVEVLLWSGQCGSFSSSPHRHSPHFQTALEEPNFAANNARYATATLLNYQVYQFCILVSTGKISNSQKFLFHYFPGLAILPKDPGTSEGNNRKPRAVSQCLITHINFPRYRCQQKISRQFRFCLFLRCAQKTTRPRAVLTGGNGHTC